MIFTGGGCRSCGTIAQDQVAPNAQGVRAGPGRSLRVVSARSLVQLAIPQKRLKRNWARGSVLVTIGGSLPYPSEALPFVSQFGAMLTLKSPLLAVLTVGV